MKKLFLLLLITPFFAIAKFQKGIVTFNDGISMRGFIETPDGICVSFIAFRNSENGESQHLTSDRVKKFEVINENNITIKYVTLKLVESGNINLKKINIENPKCWVKVIKEGKISIYSGYHLPSSFARTGYTSYYIQRENENFAIYLDENSNNDIEFKIYNFNKIKKTIKDYFADVCPNFSELLNKEDLRKNGASYLVDLYEQNCGK